MSDIVSTLLGAATLVVFVIGIGREGSKRERFIWIIDTILWLVLIAALFSGQYARASSVGVLVILNELLALKKELLVARHTTPPPLSGSPR